MEKIVENPEIPYIRPIFSNNKFSPGKSVIIKGAPLNNAYKFCINLQCGSESESKNDIALHLDVYVSDNRIILNSLHNAVWSDELQIASPIEKNQNFVICIACDINYYKISINEQLHFKFPQRIHFSQVTHLLVAGDVSVSEILTECSKNVNFDDIVTVSEISTNTDPMVNNLKTSETGKGLFKETNSNVHVTHIKPGRADSYNKKNQTKVYPIKQPILRRYCKYFGIVFGGTVIVGIIVVIKCSKRWFKNSF